MIHRATVACTILALSFTYPALGASWDYKVQTDAFDGSRQEFAYIFAPNLKSALVVHGNFQGTINPESYLIEWHPETSYLCAIDDIVYLSWLVVDVLGATLHNEHSSAWRPSSNRKVLSVNKSGTTLLDSKYNDSQALFAWMWEEKSVEIRLRYTDKCGEQYTSVFPLDGFQEAIKRILTE